jgi:hypothetical protein
MTLLALRLFVIASGLSVSLAPAAISEPDHAEPAALTAPAPVLPAASAFDVDALAFPY